MGTKGRPLFTHVCALVTITVSQSFVVCEEPNPELLKITVAAIDANPCISSMDGHSNHFLSLWICSLLRGLFSGCHATLNPKGDPKKRLRRRLMVMKIRIKREKEKRHQWKFSSTKRAQLLTSTC